MRDSLGSISPNSSVDRTGDQQPMIEVLVDRLRWPAALVRERAASQLGQLIVEEYPGVSEALMHWIEAQELESLAAIGLLPFIFAAARNGQGITDADQLASMFTAGSILSEMYLNHLDPSHAIQPAVGRHSGSPPDSWQKPNRVSERPPLNVESECLRRLQNCERVFRKSLTRQFKYEMSVLQDLHGESPRQAYWGQGDRERGYQPGWHTISHEICLSAYLRTLAWTSSGNMLPEYVILRESAFASRIDLGLWNVRPRVKPDEWPSVQVESYAGGDDIESATLIHDIECMTGTWGTGPSVVLAAGGSLSQTELKQHNLEIRAFFQRPDGPDRPTSEQIFEHLETVSASISQELSPLIFEGPTRVDTGLDRIGDWFILPCSGRVNPAVPNIWQAWRDIREIQCPSHVLTEVESQAICRNDSIDFKGNGDLIGQWSDWSDDLSALFVYGPLPANGWMLVAPQTLFQEFAEESGMKLAWVWELTSYARRYPSTEFSELRTYGEAGVSLVMRP